MAEVSLKNIFKNFDKTEVLKDVSLDIKDKEFISLVGPSGCGKSTLLKIIAGLEEQTSGSVYIDNKKVDKISPKNRDIAMVFQSYALYPHLTVFKNMAVPLVLRKMKWYQRLPLIGGFLKNTKSVKKEIKETVINTAKTLHIEELIHRKPSQLSGGQRQRVALGRAMVRHPKVFLMDEPLSNLDAKLRVQMRSEIAQLHNSLQTTFIYVTHDQTEAMTMSDRVAVMMDGVILQVGSPFEVYNNPEYIKVAEFIGSPKINLIPCEKKDNDTVNSLGYDLKIKTEDVKSEKMALGIRPEALKIMRSGNGWKGKVTFKEFLGSYLIFYIEIDCFDKPVIVMTQEDPEYNPVLNDKVTVEPNLNKIFLFNDSGGRIRINKLEKSRKLSKV